MSDGWVRAAALDAVAPGSMLGVELDGRKVCIVRTGDDEVYALEDRCSHKEFPLSIGDLEDGEITCAWHGARFDCATGRALSLPAFKPVPVYEVRVEDGQIFVSFTA